MDSRHVARKREFPSYREVPPRNTAYQSFNKSPKNELLDKHQADSIRSSKPKRSPSSQICNYWIDGNCIHGDRCRYLHSWFHSDGLSLLTKLHQHKKIVTGITLPIGSDKLISCSTDGTLRMWDRHTGQCVNVLNLGNEARCLISAGSWVFAGAWNAVKAWNIQNGAELTLDGPKGCVLAIAICNDTVFPGATDGVIYAWRGSSDAKLPFKPSATLNGHIKAVVCLTWGQALLRFLGS